MIKRSILCIFISLLLAGSVSFAAQEMQVGPIPDGGQLLPSAQLIHPLGKTLGINGRPVDLILTADGRTAYAKSGRTLVSIDVETWEVRQQIGYSEGSGSPYGLAVTRDGSRVYVTNAQKSLLEAKISDDGTMSWNRDIELPGPSFSPRLNPCGCGIALSLNEKYAYVCLTSNNSLGIVHLQSGKVLKEIRVGISPFAVALSPDGKTAYVSNWGGRPARSSSDAAGIGAAYKEGYSGDKLGMPGEEESERASVDERGVVTSGTISVVDLMTQTQITQIDVDLHPSGIALNSDGSTLYVANANSDTVSIIDTKTNTVRETVLVRPDPNLPYGSKPNTLALSADEKTLYVANGGNNALAVIKLGKKSTLAGFIPTTWHPGAVAADESSIYVACIKGWGLRYELPGAIGMGSHSHYGTFTKAPIPSGKALKGFTRQVVADTQSARILQAYEEGSADVKPVPVPEYTGEPSVFEHVVYIIKENKTYDQVLGDMDRGNGMPELCIYGRDVTPNTHALADEFVLLDNYYVCGVSSAEGHTWISEGNVTDILERIFYGRPGGGDIRRSSTGTIWDHVIDKGLTFRNYGERAGSRPPEGATWTQIYNDYLEGGIDNVELIPSSREDSDSALSKYACERFPGFVLLVPDVVRADIFLSELAEFEKNGDLPNFIVILLPNDHTEGNLPGMPSPRAEVADNDLAMGRIVEGLTRSSFWPKTCIFVEEDDAQSGFDHVDGHRSFCLVISPYTKRGALISEFYNQNSVLHTIERIFGIPPMNQMDAMAPVMSACFTGTPDFTPFAALPNIIPLDEMMGDSDIYYGAMGKAPPYDPDDPPFSRPDNICDDELNRVLWALAKPGVPYPEEYTGPHGKGLAALGLTLTGEEEDDDDD